MHDRPGAADERRPKCWLAPGTEFPRRRTATATSEEAIRRFAGEDMERAVYYPEDERFLLEKNEHVTHYEVVFEEGWRQP